MKFWFKQFTAFVWTEALCCLFPVVIFLALAVSKAVELPLLYRYDWILLVCVLMQLLLLWTKLESMDELKVIFLFHLIGLALEIFKVNMGSWSYPEQGFTKIWGVPLYSGFMYSSVASYVCQAWKRFDLQMIRWPKGTCALLAAVLIYLNFFTHHYIYDFRWLLIAGLVALFFKTRFVFTVRGVQYRISALLSFLLIAFFIWLAENISTFFGAWKYPDQEQVWKVVHFGKISSWFLLVLISIMIVAELKFIKYGRAKER